LNHGLVDPLLATSVGYITALMTAKEVRAIAMSLPEAEEKPHFERTSFRVGRKIFATMTADGDEAMVNRS
jgi:hypothetical protein